METLLELRDKALAVYSQYKVYIDKALKFLIVLTCLLWINNKIGYNEDLKGALPVLLIALVCTLLPVNGIVLILSILIVVHLYALSLEAALVGAILFLVLALVYFRFSPKDSYLLLLYPVCSTMGVSYVLPIAGGLLYTPVSGIAVAVGVIAERFLLFVNNNETSIRSEEIDVEEMISRFQFLIDGIVDDRLMLIRTVAVIAAAALVYFVRRLSISYAWIIASGVGALTQLIILLVGAIAFDTNVNVLAAIVGAVMSFCLGVVISFIAFNLDYSRTETTQFEDDEYYYYVKAVPKNVYARPRHTVKTISHHEGRLNSLLGRHGKEEWNEDTAPWQEREVQEREDETLGSYTEEPYEEEGPGNWNRQDTMQEYPPDDNGGDYTDNLHDFHDDYPEETDDEGNPYSNGY